MKIIPLLILISLCFINVHLQTRTGGISPIFKIPSLPYFIIQPNTLIPSTYGATSFLSSGNPYSLTVIFDKLMASVNQSNIVTIGYSSKSNWDIAYNFINTLTNSGSSIEIELSVLATTSLFKLHLSIIRTSDSLLQGNSYLILFEISSNSPTNPGSISMPNFTGYQIYPFIKFMSIILNDTLPGSPQSQGFQTKYEIKNTTNSGVMLDFWFEKEDPTSTFFTLSVTWVVILINPTMYKKTAQFSSLSHIIQQDLATSGTPVSINNYNYTHKTNLLVGTGQFIQINPQSSVFEFVINSNSITFTTNSLNSQHRYLMMQLVDLACPSAAPYKYKNDPLCYPCSLGTEVYIRNISHTQYHRNIQDQRCIQIIRPNSGYWFDQEDGEILAICAYCKECRVNYYLQSGKCHECRVKVPNCEQCTANAVCTKCFADFNLVDLDLDPLNNNSYCQKTVNCGPNCLTCNANASSCLTCANGFKKVDPESNSTTQNSFCSIQCQPTNCLSCNSDGTSCTTCNPGYQTMLNSVSGKFECQVICPPNCKDCSTDKDSCNTCDPGYEIFFDPISSKNLCNIRCSSNCLQCNHTSCTLCQVNFTLHATESDPSNFICKANPVQCGINCQECLSSSQCKKCKPAFILDGSQCKVECGSFCQSCNANGSQCYTCVEGYRSIDNRNCEKMPKVSVPSNVQQELNVWKILISVFGGLIFVFVVVLVIWLYKRGNAVNPNSTPNPPQQPGILQFSNIESILEQLYPKSQQQKKIMLQEAKKNSGIQKVMF